MRSLFPTNSPVKNLKKILPPTSSRWLLQHPTVPGYGCSLATFFCSIFGLISYPHFYSLFVSSTLSNIFLHWLAINVSKIKHPLFKRKERKEIRHAESFAKINTWPAQFKTKKFISNVYYLGNIAQYNMTLNIW